MRKEEHRESIVIAALREYYDIVSILCDAGVDLNIKHDIFYNDVLMINQKPYSNVLDIVSSFLPKSFTKIIDNKFRVN